LGLYGCEYLLELCTRHITLMDRNQVLVQQYLLRLDVFETCVEVLLVDEPRAAVISEDLLGYKLLIVFVGIS
jgi:hypothetical protein